MTGQTSVVPGPPKVVLGDVNVLYSWRLRDDLVYAADEGAISIRWSWLILTEFTRYLRVNNARFDKEHADLLIGLRNGAYPARRGGADGVGPAHGRHARHARRG